MQKGKEKFDYDLIIGHLKSAFGVSESKIGAKACEWLYQLFYTTPHELRNRPSTISGRLQLAEMLVGTLHRAEVENFIARSPDVAVRLRSDLDRLTAAAEKLVEQCERAIRTEGSNGSGSGNS